MPKWKDLLRRKAYSVACRTSCKEDFIYEMEMHGYKVDWQEGTSILPSPHRTVINAVTTSSLPSSFCEKIWRFIFFSADVSRDLRSSISSLKTACIRNTVIQWAKVCSRCWKVCSKPCRMKGASLLLSKIIKSISWSSWSWKCSASRLNPKHCFNIPRTVRRRKIRALGSFIKQNYRNLQKCNLWSNEKSFTKTHVRICSFHQSKKLLRKPERAECKIIRTR